MSGSMTYSYPFSPSQGATITFQANTVIPTAVQSTAGLGLYLVTNTSGAQVVRLGWGVSAAAAATAAGSISTSVILLPYTTQVFTLDRNLWFTGYALSASDVYITAGFGV